jgi:hypothetical protein
MQFAERENARIIRTRGRRMDAALVQTRVLELAHAGEAEFI